MRGIKRKRDLVNVTESVEGDITHGQPVTVGERSNQVSPGQADPVNCYVPGLAHHELGLLNPNPTQLNRFGGESERVQANRLTPVVDQVTRRPNDKGGGGLVAWATSQLGTEVTGDAHPSLAAEASDWLGARNTLAGRLTRANQVEPTETSGPEPPTDGLNIEERHLTQEDFWSLLRDAGYETW